MANTLINGTRPSFVSVSVVLAGKDQPRGVFRSLSYGITQEPGLVYSKSRSEIVGQTPGTSHCTGSFEMLVTEYNKFASDLTNDGEVAVTDVTFDAQASYNTNDIDTQSDVLAGCKISGVSANSSGADALTRTCSFTFAQLATNGITVGGTAAQAPRQGNTELLQVPVASDFWFPTYEDDNGLWFSPGFTGNTYSDYPWDYVLVTVPYSGDEQPKTPGICEVQVTKTRSVDKKKAAGTDGTRNTIHGINAAEGEIQVTVWTPQQLRMLQEMWSVIFPGPQKFTTTKTVTLPPKTTTSVRISGGSIASVTKIPRTPQTKRVSTTQTKSVVRPFDVDHPKFKMHDVKSVVFIEGSGPDPGPTPWTRVFTMKWVEFTPIGKVNATTTPVASKASTLEPTGYQTPGSNPANRAP